MKDGEHVLEETSSRLAKGLKSCRTVVDNYRALLTTDLSAEQAAAASIAEAQPSLIIPDHAQG